MTFQQPKTSQGAIPVPKTVTFEEFQQVKDHRDKLVASVENLFHISKTFLLSSYTGDRTLEMLIALTANMKDVMSDCDKYVPNANDPKFQEGNFAERVHFVFENPKQVTKAPVQKPKDGPLLPATVKDGPILPASVTQVPTTVIRQITRASDLADHSKTKTDGSQSPSEQIGTVVNQLQSISEVCKKEPSQFSASDWTRKSLADKVTTMIQGRVDKDEIQKTLTKVTEAVVKRLSDELKTLGVKQAKIEEIGKKVLADVKTVLTAAESKPEPKETILDRPIFDPDA